MMALALSLMALPFVIGGYAYVGYPAMLWLLTRVRPRAPAPPAPASWPTITITVPVYNEAATISATLDALLDLDYPVDRRHIVVLSDASTDGTDELVRGYAVRGVTLVRLPVRSGKSVVENVAAEHTTGDIIVNVDATVRLEAGALQPLVAAFGDPSVGVASGRDVSVGAIATEANRGESGYVGYEMWIRQLETGLGGIVGASGCFYATRRALYVSDFPGHLSRDFASCLLARDAGYRAVSVNEAVCQVPRTGSLAAEYRRKVRTMARGLATLWYLRRLMNPFRFGGFALKLLSHKAARWLVSLALPVAVLGLVLLATTGGGGLVLLGLTLAGVGVGVVGLRWPAGRPAPAVVTRAGFALAANVAGVVAWFRALTGRRAAVWEPTRRVTGGPSAG